MRGTITIALIAVAVSGCVQGPYAPSMQPVGIYCENPVLIPAADPQCVWEGVVDVVDDYFKVAHEEPVRLVGNILTEGRLETVPQISPTVLEPWRRDTADDYQRVENTLQSIRRRAVVNVMPGQGGYWVNVVVLKELEDVVQPENATAGTATFRYDDTLRRVVNPVGEIEVCEGWIPQGRDTMLEQKIVSNMRGRLTAGARF